MLEHEQVVIVGAGPAGTAAANQLELYGVSPLVFEKDRPGGLLLEAGSVVNYPGAPRGITGCELYALFPVPKRIVKGQVTSLSRQPEGLYEVVWNAGSLECEAVIAAPGTVPVQIPLPGVEPERVFYGLGKVPQGGYSSAAVIGGGDAALDYALTLSRFARVTVYARSGLSGAVPHLAEGVLSNGSVTLRLHSPVPGSFREDIVVVACGRKPELGFIKEDLSCTPGDGSFHLCGDCRNGMFRQASIAAGDGVRAAMATAEYLKGDNT